MGHHSALRKVDSTPPLNKIKMIINMTNPQFVKARNHHVLQLAKFQLFTMLHLPYEFFDVGGHRHRIRVRFVTSERSSLVIYQELGKIPLNIGVANVGREHSLQERINLPGLFPVDVALLEPRDLVLGAIVALDEI